MTPKFSIAIPAYNRSDYLRQAIKSCLAQTTPDFEVIVSDDCSSEDLRAVGHDLRRLRRRRVSFTISAGCRTIVRPAKWIILCRKSCS
jgi:glycosyltransferase involved in cell wall biosynthesis